MRRKTWPLADLAGISELAEEFDTLRSRIHNWTTRYNDFPQPILTLACGSLYSRSQVRSWAERTGKAIPKK